VIEITDAIDRLHLTGVQELNQIPVRFVLRAGARATFRSGASASTARGSECAGLRCCAT
jgi:hypothetical protein